MKKRTKNLVTIIVLSPLLVVLLYWGCLMLFAAGGLKALTFRSRLNTLLYQTDHQALLTACRKLIDEGYRGQYNMGWPDKHPDVEKFPKEILRLKPTYVYVHDDGRVVIEMWGGMSHYGVVAHAADFQEPYEGYVPGNKKLIDGLWFYSDFIDLNQEKQGRLEHRENRKIGTITRFETAISATAGGRGSTAWDM